MSKRLIFYLFFLIQISIFSIPADVEDISNRKYFPEVLKSIQNAEQSIKASLYYISYYKSKKGRVHDLLNALFDASKRGVEVEVILDRGFEFSGSKNDMSKKNIRSFSHLKKNGIKVYYDDIEVLSHSKYLIVDEKIVIVGSFNWSEKSLTKNREAAVLIKSPDIAKVYLQIFDKIPKFSPEPVKNAIPIPREFLKNRNLVAKMISRQNPKALDIYLWLQKRSYETNSSTITLTKQEILDNIYQSEKVAFRRNSVIQDVMHRYLRIYKKYYDFIKSYKRNKKQETLTIELFKTNKIDFDSLYLSENYWKYDWDDKLTPKAKFCFLYALDKTESGRMGRYFSQLQFNAEKEYGPSHIVFSHGFTELQRFNIVDKRINFVVGEKNPNGYILNEFYDYPDWQKTLKQLEKKTDKEIFQAVSTIADLVNEPNDLDVYKNLITLGDKYGLETLKYAIKEIEEHENGISPYRRYKYVVGMIKQMNKANGCFC